MVGLRAQAEADLGRILEDADRGFGWPITVTDPSGVIGLLTGFSTDISLMIDPETGQAVSGRTASATIRIALLKSKGLGVPQAVADGGVKPWLVQFDDINGVPYTFKVKESIPDRAIGAVSCILEFYK